MSLKGNTMTTTEAVKLALEALENAEYGDYDKKELNKAITALREALARPQSLPDKLVYDGYETPQYIEGWNDCREFMKGMK